MKKDLEMIDFVWKKHIMENDADYGRIFKHLIDLYVIVHEEQPMFKSSLSLKAERN